MNEKQAIVHFVNTSENLFYTACGLPRSLKPGAPKYSLDPGKVSCDRCKRTESYSKRTPVKAI